MGRSLAASITLLTLGTALAARSAPVDPDVFRAEPAGARHVQSGLICPKAITSLTLTGLQAYPAASKGDDIGCDYARKDAGTGKIEAKLTIFAVRAGATTLDQAFAKYQNEVQQSYHLAPAAYAGPALVVNSDKGPGSEPFGDFKSAEYKLKLGDENYLTDIIVSLRGGWIIEIRATYPAVAEVRVGEPVASSAVGDATAPAQAFLAAATSVPRQQR